MTGLEALTRVLVAEDEVTARMKIHRGLVLEGYDVTMVENGAQVLSTYREGEYDLIILDINMPEMDGYAVCRELRKRTDVPIIIVTVNSRTDDVVEGYKLGADVYVTKPFSGNELSARIRGLLNRVARHQNQADSVLSAGEIVLNDETHEVFVRDERVNLSPNEYRLLYYFLSHPNHAVTKEELLAAVWGYGSDEDANLVRVTVYRLRSKIEPVPSRPTYLQTVRGIGYCFVAHTDETTVDTH